MTSGNGTKSGGYVLIERVTGTVNGKRGSFSLQHSGLMDNGEPNLTIVVVPGSGTEQLTGMSGKFTLNLDDIKVNLERQDNLEVLEVKIELLHQIVVAFQANARIAPTLDRPEALARSAT